MDNSWRPNWKEIAAYPNHEDDMALWAYEFLRRNPDYQADYARWDVLPWYYDKGGHTPKEACRNGGGFVPIIFYHTDQPTLPNETADEYCARTGTDYFDLITLARYLLDKWGLEVELPNPFNPDNVFFVELPYDLPPYAISGNWEVGTHGFYDIVPKYHLENDWYYQEQAKEIAPKLLWKTWGRDADKFVHAFGIDLRYNIDVQLDTIRKILTDIKEEEPISTIKPLQGVHTRLLRPYLRVLDAMDANASDDGIRDVIYAEEISRRPSRLSTPNDIRDWNEKANKWVGRAKIEAKNLTNKEGYQRLFIGGSFRKR